jgi:hypothetical protein
MNQKLRKKPGVAQSLHNFTNAGFDPELGERATKFYVAGRASAV